MLFNSYIFIFCFLPVAVTLYFLFATRSHRLANVFLAIASLFFYAYWKFEYLPILLSSVIVNYIFGRVILEQTSKRMKCTWLVVVAILFNVFLLGYYKYADFAIFNINAVFSTDIEFRNILLPLAISFFTFQQIAYIVDCSRGEVKDKSFYDYILFITFFPQLIAGPIVHHSEMMPQFADNTQKKVNLKNVASGIFIFAIGLAKKVVVADALSPYVSNIFDVASVLTCADAWSGSLAYTMQLYFDFSGYCDMAIGIALMFNIRLPINFYSPYKATNIQEFWRCWHMTLSRFFMEYIYIPLGGNRKGNCKTYLNLFTVFVIGGIWHGAAWTFVVWGIMHGLAIVVHRIWRFYGVRMWTPCAWFLTFMFVNVAWVFFRAQSFGDALKVLRAMFDFNLSGWSAGFIYPKIILFVALLISFFFANGISRLEKFKPDLKSFIFVSILLVLSFAQLSKYSEFLYFNF